MTTVVKQKLLLRSKEVFVNENEKKTISIKTKKAVKNNVIINGDILNDDLSVMTDNAIDLSSISGSEVETYVTPVYGVKMRVSLDNKYIFSMDLKLVGVVVNDKNIDWIEK